MTYIKNRCQWNLKKMTPTQYRNHLLVALLFFNVLLTRMPVLVKAFFIRSVTTKITSIPNEKSSNRRMDKIFVQKKYQVEFVGAEYTLGIMLIFL